MFEASKKHGIMVQEVETFNGIAEWKIQTDDGEVTVPVQRFHGGLYPDYSVAWFPVQNMMLVDRTLSEREFERALKVAKEKS